MSKVKHIALAIGALLGGSYLWRLNQLKNKIVTLIVAKRGNADLQGINIVLNYNIKNPTKTSIALKPPFVKVLFEGELIASSQIKETEIPVSVKDTKGRIQVLAFRETGNIPIQIRIPWISVLNISSGLMRKLQSSNPKEKVKMEIETLAQIYTLAGSYPLEEITAIEL